MFMYKYLKPLLFILFFCSNSVFGQNHKYLFIFKDKTNSNFSINNPSAFLSQRAIDRRKKQKIAISQQDIPVNTNYIKNIKELGAKVWYTSKWINGILVECDSITKLKILDLSFIKGIEQNTFLESPKDNGQIAGDTPPIAITTTQYVSTPQVDTIKYGDSGNQIKMLGLDKLHNAGFKGEGMIIGILDDGFKNTDRVPFLKTIIDEKRILATYNFVKNKIPVYEDGGHGTQVLSCIAADVNNKFYGSAFKASFVLLKTEKLEDESLLEEANILFALEYADSLGVDVVNMSLGYTKMDNALTSHNISQRDGSSTIAARAADWGASKGIIIVVAAGNSGTSTDNIISTPADADSVLSVGGVDATKTYWSKSSIGPRIDGVVKPDLMAQGGGTTIGSFNGNIATSNGTSFASPLVAGLAAVFWQANPTRTAMQVINALRKSGNTFKNPSTKYGYGIPSPDSALKILLSLPKEILGLEKQPIKMTIYPNPFKNTSLPKVHFLSNNKKYSASVINQNGEIIWQSHLFKNATILPLSNLKSGQYFFKLTNGKETGIKKIVKN